MPSPTHCRIRESPTGTLAGAPDGDRLRVYLLADVPNEPGRFGRIFRSRAFMVNFLNHYDGPRDRGKLSPITTTISNSSRGGIRPVRPPHPDTVGNQRRSLARRRAPTGGQPLVAVIHPDRAHHEAVGSSRNQLIDIFARPGRLLRETWLGAHADEYPAP